MIYKFISADNHLDLLWMPANLWQAALPVKHKEVGPSIARQFDDLFAGVAESTKRRVLFDHTAELFDIRVPATA